MKIQIEDDFSPSKIAQSGQCFRVREENGIFTFLTGDSVLRLKGIGEGTWDADCTESEWKNVWIPYFDLERNYKSIRESIPESDSFHRIASEWGTGIRILRQEPFEMLITFIISQQKNIPAIKHAVELLSSRYGKPFTNCPSLSRFPTPKELGTATLSDLLGARLGYRAPYLLDATERVNNGKTDLASLAALPDPELLAKLKEIKGVGNKVANCIALFAYGRVGLAPVDTWISKIIDTQYGGVNPYPSFGENAGILQQYAFFFAQTHKQFFSLPGESNLPGGK